MSFTCKEPKLRFPEFSVKWEEKTLGDLIQSLDAGISVNSTDRPAKSNEKSILKTSCVSYDIFNISENKVVLDDIEIQRLKEPVTANSIIISRMNTPALVGANAFVKYDNFNTFLPDRLWAAKIRKDASPLWTSILISSTNIRRLLSERATGTSNSMKNITKGDVLTLPIVIPSKPEQEKIASFLTVVDAKIEQLTCKEKLLEKYKKSAMQKLFSQELRFICNDGSEYPEWEEKKLGEIGKFNAGGDLDKLDYSKEKNEKYLYPIYANGAGEGLYGYATTFQYKENCVTVSGRGSLGYANVRNQKFNAIVRLIVIKPKENVNSKFLEESINKINFAIESTGVPQLTVPQISSYKINIPSLEEQTKIANFLSAIDEKCLHVKHQLEQTRQFKKALLQQMFV